MRSKYKILVQQNTLVVILNIYWTFIALKMVRFSRQIFEIWEFFTALVWHFGITFLFYRILAVWELMMVFIWIFICFFSVFLPNFGGKRWSHKSAINMNGMITQHYICSAISPRAISTKLNIKMANRTWILTILRKLYAYQNSI